MSNAIRARMLGDDYQALFFWTHAFRLFFEHMKVIKVEYEANIKGFDDVIVHYSNHIDEYTNPLHADYFQVKFHITQGGSISWTDLMDPKFINASSVSFIQRAYNAFVLSGQKFGRRYILVTPWVIHPDDALAPLVDNQFGTLRLDKLFDGRPKTKMAEIREALCVHLKIDSEELQTFLRTIRLWAGHDNLERLGEVMNMSAILAGFQPVVNGSLLNPYVNLVHEMNKREIKVFTREILIENATRENLYIDRRENKDDKIFRLGIRSFFRRTSHLEDENVNLLNLLQHFNGREIKDPLLWQSSIYPMIEDFVQLLKSDKEYHIFLDAHYSVAFTAGYCLDPKSGLNVYPIQSFKGRKVWKSELPHKTLYSKWIVNVKQFEPSNENQSNDVVLIINLTHDINADVDDFLKEQSFSASKILSYKLDSDTGHESIKDGTHAWLLAEQLSRDLRQKRSVDERRSPLHIFYSGPVSLLFFIGQLARSFGTCIIYEYQFEHQGTYLRGITLPVNQ